MWPAVILAAMLAGAVAFIYSTADARAAAKYERINKAAQEDRAKVNKSWESQARLEADAGDERVKAKEAEIDLLKKQLTERRPANVTKFAVDSCRLTAGVVRQHNDAAAGRAGVNVQPGAAFAVDAPAGIGIDKYSAAVEGNYTTCRKYINRADEWQRWAAQSCRTWNEKYGRKDECPPFPGPADGQSQNARGPTETKGSAK